MQTIEAKFIMFFFLTLNMLFVFFFLIYFEWFFYEVKKIRTHFYLNYVVFFLYIWFLKQKKSFVDAVQGFFIYYFY